MFIGYIRIPQFPVAVARRDDPALVGQPLILVEEQAGHARVYAACERALACGVRPGMSLTQARRLCPAARLAPATESRYLTAFESCLDVLGLFAPRIEPEELGSAYLDLSEMVHDPDETTDLYRQLARQLRRDQQLAASMGVTATMFGAAVAGLYMRPGFALALPSGVERPFLALFPTRVLPVSNEMIRRLQLLGLRQIGQYADLPAGVILNQFGWEGQRAHRLARGQDDRHVHPGRPRLIETAGHSFDDPIADATILAAVRDRLVSQLLDRIRERYLAPQAMHVQIDFETGPAREAQVVFPAPTADEGELQRAADRLTRSISINSGVLRPLPSDVLSRSKGLSRGPSKGRVTAIEVGISKLQPLVGRQLTLFPTQADQERQLRQMLDNLTRRYGRDGFRQPQVVDAGALVLERRFVLNRWAHE